MTRALLVVALAVVGVARAQAVDERNGPASTGLRLEAGGPAMVGDPVRVASLSASTTETDAVIKTGLGDFALTRTFSSTPETWEAAWDGPLWHGKAVYHPAETTPSIHWWSALSASAVQTSTTGINPTRVVRIRDASGDLVASDVLDDATGVTQGSQNTRVVRSPATPTPTSFTLVRPGVGRSLFQFEHQANFGLYTILRYYRLEAFYPDRYATTSSTADGEPLYTLSYYASAPLQVEWINLFGGTQLHVTWASGHVASVELNGVVIVRYEYSSSNQLSMVYYPRSSAQDYVFYWYGAIPVGTPFMFNRSSGTFDSATPLISYGRSNFIKTIAGDGIYHNMGSSWILGPTTVSTDWTPDTLLTYTPNVNGWVPAGPDVSRAVSLAQSGNVISDQYTTHRTDGMTREVALSCRTPSGGACSDVGFGSSSWSVLNWLPEPVDAYRRDIRNSYTVNDANLACWPASPCPGDPAGIQDTEVSRVRAGATDTAGTQAKTDTNFTYQYASDARLTHERLPATIWTASVLQGTTTDSFQYDLNTKALTAHFRTGWTKVIGNPSPVQRRVATFYFNRYACAGGTTPDVYNRTLEIEGPCFVDPQNPSPTGCDVGLNQGPIPVTQYEYWPMGTGLNLDGRLKSVSTFTNATAAGCVGAKKLTTQYTGYDLRGHVTNEIDPNNVMTTRVYDGEKLTLEVKAGAATSYVYLSSQGGALSAKCSPAGVWEVYCYRAGADDACAGGTLSDHLQWKARTSATSQNAATSYCASASGLCVFIEKTVYNYEGPPRASVGNGKLVSESMWKRTGTQLVFQRQVTHQYDSLDRESGRGVGSPVAYQSASLFDEVGNQLGNGAPFNAPPGSCGGQDWSEPPYAKPASDDCTRFRYDRLNRVDRTETFSRPGQGTNNGRVRTDFTYDGHANLTTVVQDPGGTQVTYTYDDFGNVIEVAGQWMVGSTKQEFDARGNLVKRQTPELTKTGTTLIYGWDGMNRPGSAGSQSGNTGYLFWRYGYDDNVASPPTNCLAPGPTAARTAGRVQWKDDSFGRTWYEYDSLGNITKLRRVRAGPSGACSSSATSSSNDTPDTEYYYYGDGRLYMMKYPHGRLVYYMWGFYGSGSMDRVIQIWAFTNGVWAPLIADVRYDVDGQVEAYQLATSTPSSVEWLRRGAMGTTPPTSCATARPPSSDGTGRLSMLLVSRQPLTADESLRTGDAYKVYSTWSADQLVAESGCLLGESSPRTLTYAYDGTLQVTGGTGNVWGQGPFFNRNYTYTNGSDRDFAVEDNIGFKATYDSRRRMTDYSPKPTSCQTCLDSSWRLRKYEWDDDGRMTLLRDTPMPSPTPAAARTLAMSPSDEYGAVYRAVSVNGATYQYYYDAQGRRRVKVYPTLTADEYFYDGDRIIEDRGGPSKYWYLGSPTTIDEYVWLGSMPVAVLKSTFDYAWQRNPADLAETGCTRNDEPEACGAFFIINDGLPKPVAMLDSAARVVGVGEYDVFGRVNTVTRVGDSPAPPGTGGWPFGNYYANQSGVFLATIYEMPRGTDRVQARFNYAAVNTSGPTDFAVAKVWNGLPLTPQVSGPMGGAQDTPWFEVPFGNFVDALWTSDSIQETAQYPYTGVTVAGWEYRQYENGASPRWLPLRFPGQYADAETGLFENWNRFYDPATGRYTAPDPLNEGEHGIPLAVNSYAYAASNPLAAADATGRIVANYQQMANLLRGNTTAIGVLDKIHDRKDMVFVIVAGTPKDGKGNPLWAATRPPRSASDKLVVIVINDVAIMGAGASKTSFAEEVTHEMDHADQAAYGQTPTDYLQQDQKAYRDQIASRREQALPLDKTWLDAHQAMEFAPAPLVVGGRPVGFSASEASKDWIVGDTIRGIRESRPSLQGGKK